MTSDQASEKENADDDELYDNCEQMYEEAAKCNVNLPYTSNGNDDEWAETQDATTCAFLEAVQKGNIDKHGYVHLSFNKYLSKYINKFNNDYLPETMYLTDLQFIGILTGSVLLVVAAVYGVAFKKQDSVETKELKASLV